MPKVNEAGLALIKQYEGYNPTGYVDPGTGGEPYTACWGHTGPDVELGVTYTEAQCEAWLEIDLSYFESGVNDAVDCNLTPNEFAACVSFAYNVGLGAFESSTLLRQINAGNFDAAADQFGAWVHGGDGQVMLGLVARREAEKELFLKP